MRRFGWLLVAALPGPALADEPAAPIIVTGRGLADMPATAAYDTVILDRDALTRSASGRIEDVLAGVAGFQQFRRSDSRSANPSAQGVTLRALGGNASSRTLVLLDGVPVADPFFGYIPLSALDPEQLARVRVTRGGGSGAFGAGAVAGTIELESADAATLGLIGGEALVNDRGETALSAALAPQFGSGFAVVSGRWDRGQGFWTAPASQRVPASTRAAFDGWSAAARMAAPLSGDVELQARLGGFSDHRTLRFAGADSTSSGADASLRLVGRGDWQFDALGYVQLRGFSNVVISSTSFRKTLDQRSTPSTGLGGKLELRPPLGADHAMRIGLDWRRAQGEAIEDAYSAVTGLVTARRRAGGVVADLGLFAQDDWTLGDFVLSAGVRADRWTIRDGQFVEATPAGVPTTATAFAARSGWDASWRGGAVWQAAPVLSLRAAAYTGLRLPTLNELYRPFVVFPVTTRANGALANERLRGVNAGFDLTPLPGITLSATAFDDRVKGAIANVTIATNLRERRNVDAVRAQGLELTAAARAGAFALDPSLALPRARVNARGPAAALDGKRPAQTPGVALSTTASWAPCQRCRLAVTVRHLGAAWEDDLETDRLPPATTLDMVTEVPLGAALTLLGRVENLADAEVITRNQGGSLDLGSPRTVWLGLRLGR